MKNSLETAVEAYFVGLFRTDPTLRKKQFRHGDSDREAEPNVITVAANQGEELLEGPRGPNGERRSSVEVKARYRSTASSGQNDLVAEAMQKCIRTANTRHVKTEPGFYLLILTEEVTGERGHTAKTRNRELTVPCEAGLLA